MSKKDLKNKPLVEAILEVKWVIKEQSVPDFSGDPHYRLLLGRFFERVKEEYPAHEPLPTSHIPDDMVTHVVQHRFRVKPNGWPLLQLGPGILTVNETDGYTWTDFRQRCEKAVANLVDAHPAREEFQVQDITLRYIDAVACDFKKESVFQFLQGKMKINIALPDSLFADVQVDRNPSTFSWQASFPNRRPEGGVTLRLATGQKNNQPTLIWEILIVSQGLQVPMIPEKFSDWLKEAHIITDDWFFKLIEGELKRRFSGD